MSAAKSNRGQNGGLNMGNSGPNNPANSGNPPTAWGYFGYDILFALPIIGTIFLFIYAFDNSNLARRNYARSKFIPFFIWGLMIIGLCIFALIIYAKNGWAFS